MNILIPDKYTDIKDCFVTKTSFMIKIVSDNKNISLYSLYSELKKEFSFISDMEFIYALDVLYLYDIIFYDKKTDNIRLKNDY